MVKEILESMSKNCEKVQVENITVRCTYFCGAVQKVKNNHNRQHLNTEIDPKTKIN